MRQNDEDDSLSQEELLRKAAYASDLHKALILSAPRLMPTDWQPGVPSRLSFEKSRQAQPDRCWAPLPFEEEPSAGSFSHFRIRDTHIIISLHNHIDLWFSGSLLEGLTWPITSGRLTLVDWGKAWPYSPSRCEMWSKLAHSGHPVQAGSTIVRPFRSKILLLPDLSTPCECHVWAGFHVEFGRNTPKNPSKF
jgi:hypothetical protein